MEHKNWMGFCGESWKEHIDVRSFIQDTTQFTPEMKAFSPALQKEHENY